MRIEPEALSAVVDGEQNAAADDVLEEISSEQSARDQWARYHLIGDVMRDSLVDVAAKDFSQQLRAQINEEPTIIRPRKRNSSYRRPLAGLAIAASVAAIAVTGVGRIAPETQAPVSVSLSPAVSVSAVTKPLLVAESDVSVKAAQDKQPKLPSTSHSPRRLNGYLVKFNEQRSSVGMPGVNPYVRIVGFETQE
jgi:sigma-E factor negative regulatory protein RseA